jgi:hypothetical protein
LPYSSYSCLKLVAPYLIKQINRKDQVRMGYQQWQAPENLRVFKRRTYGSEAASSDTEATEDAEEILLEELLKKDEDNVGSEQ